MAKKLWIENIQIFPAAVWQEQSPNDDFIDYSNDMLKWDMVNVMDWSRRRDEISSLFYAMVGTNLSGYNSITLEQKKIGAKYFLVPYSLRVNNGIVTEDQDKINWDYLLIKTKESRINCIEAMRKIVGEQIRLSNLTLSQTQQFLRDVYIYVDWFERANAPDLKQWITNEVGSLYENNGFAQTGYHSTSLRDTLMDIYNGNYA